MKSKEIGVVSEYLFISEALKRGFNVSVPLGDNLPYDCILDANGKLLKVQIKTAWLSRSKLCEGLLFSAGPRNTLSNQKVLKHRWYAKNAFDFAAVLDPRDGLFFIIPGDLFINCRRSLIQYTYKKQRVGKPNFGLFKERWDLFAEG